MESYFASRHGHTTDGGRATFAGAGLCDARRAVPAMVHAHAAAAAGGEGSLIPRPVLRGCGRTGRDWLGFLGGDRTLGAGAAHAGAGIRFACERAVVPDCNLRWAGIADRSDRGGADGDQQPPAAANASGGCGLRLYSRGPLGTWN